MCYTQTMSALLALSIFAVAAFEHRAWGCWHYTLGLIYFGLMEGLQAIQHSYLAVPEDQYQMCQSTTNQFLTYIGGLHVCFQPYFANFCFQGFFRRHHLKDRIESDLIQKLCLLGGAWYFLNHFWVGYFTEEGWAPPATKECPNYNWVRDGYDEALEFTTPNLPGKACTFLSPSDEGHLAWVFPNTHTSYYQPNTYIHAFLMFGPHLAMARTRPIIAGICVLLFLTGPVLAAYWSPAVNEQPAIWCYASVLQCFFLVVVYRWYGVYQERPSSKRIVHPGKLGEEPIVYMHILQSKEDHCNNDEDYHKPLLLVKESDSLSDDDANEWGKCAGKRC